MRGANIALKILSKCREGFLGFVRHSNVAVGVYIDTIRFVYSNPDLEIRLGADA
jgi:hypothetical protein